MGTKVTFATVRRIARAFPGVMEGTSYGTPALRVGKKFLARMREFLAREDAVVFIAVRADGRACGYVEVGSRPYADGCDTSPVGYIEAWYVHPDERRLGYGRALLAAADEWGRQRGYREMASDTQLHNEVSRQAHERSGYREVDRIIQFRKVLG